MVNQYDDTRKNVQQENSIDREKVFGYLANQKLNPCSLNQNKFQFKSKKMKQLKDYEKTWLMKNKSYRDKALLKWHVKYKWHRHKKQQIWLYKNIKFPHSINITKILKMIHELKKLYDEKQKWANVKKNQEFMKKEI